MLDVFLGALNNIWGGGVVLALGGVKQIRRLAPSSLIGWIIVAFAFYSTATLIGRGYSFYSEEIVREVKRTENAMKRHQGCGKLPAELQGIEVFEDQCEEYYYIIKSSTKERAWNTLMDKLPKPENIPKIILSSAENSFFATTIFLGLAFVIVSLLQPVRDKGKDKALKYRRAALEEQLMRQVLKQQEGIKM
jgi:hypothetical protein